MVYCFMNLGNIKSICRKSYKAGYYLYDTETAKIKRVDTFEEAIKIAPNLVVVNTNIVSGGINLNGQVNLGVNSNGIFVAEVGTRGMSFPAVQLVEPLFVTGKIDNFELVFPKLNVFYGMDMCTVSVVINNHEVRIKDISDKGTYSGNLMQLVNLCDWETKEEYYEADGEYGIFV